MEDVFGKAEIIVAKQRHAPTGTVRLAFQTDYTRFSDLAESDKLPDNIGKSHKNIMTDKTSAACLIY